MKKRNRQATHTQTTQRRAQVVRFSKPRVWASGKSKNKKSGSQNLGLDQRWVLKIGPRATACFPVSLANHRNQPSNDIVTAWCLKPLGSARFASKCGKVSIEIPREPLATCIPSGPYPLLVGLWNKMAVPLAGSQAQMRQPMATPTKTITPTKATLSQA